MYITTPTLYKLSIQEARRKLCNTLIQCRCVNPDPCTTSNSNLQLKTSSFSTVDEQLELHDVRLPLYLKIYYRKDPYSVLLECWRIVFESDPYGTKEKKDFKIVLQQLALCLRVVHSYALLIPAHKLIRQRNKLNQNFTIEYQLSNNFEKSDFKYSSIKDHQLFNIVTEEGGFSVSVSFLPDLSIVQLPNYIQISTNDYSRNRQLLKTYSTAPELTIHDSESTGEENTPKNLSPSLQKAKEEIKLRRSYTIPLYSILRDESAENLSIDDSFTLETPTSSSFNSSHFNPFRPSGYSSSIRSHTSSSEIGFNPSTPGSKGMTINSETSKTSNSFSLSEGDKEIERKQSIPQDANISVIAATRDTIDLLIG